MKTIFVDAVDAFVIEGRGIFSEMQELLDNFPNRKILMTGANDQQWQEFGLDNMPYPVFTLKHNPEKTDPAYYRQALEKFNLEPGDVVYFEHNPDAVTSAESVGIRTYFYDPDKHDLIALKEFLESHL